MNDKLTFVLEKGLIKTITSKEILGQIVETEKYISSEDFGSLMDSFKNEDSGWLPGNHGLKRYKKTKNNEYYLYITESKRIDNVMFNDKQFSIDTPAICWGIVLDTLSKKVVLSYSFALKEDAVTLQESLYLNPTSNIYSNGKICWGQNSNYEYPTKQSIQSVYDRFYGAPFNTDLDDNRFNSFVKNGIRVSTILNLFNENNSWIKKDKKTHEECLNIIEEKMIKSQYTIASLWNKIESYS